MYYIHIHGSVGFGMEVDLNTSKSWIERYSDKDDHQRMLKYQLSILKNFVYNIVFQITQKTPYYFKVVQMTECHGHHTFKQAFKANIKGFMLF